VVFAAGCAGFVFVGWIGIYVGLLPGLSKVYASSKQVV